MAGVVCEVSIELDKLPAKSVPVSAPAKVEDVPGDELYALE